MTITEIETRAKAAGRTIASILILADVSRATFWRWKTGKFQPRASSIARIRSIILSLEKSGKHTPGPWLAAPNIADEPAFAVGLSKWEDGTACGCDASGDDYLLLTSCNLTEANARLIAAAPDMLNDLEVIRIIATSPHHPNALSAIRKIAANAIAKATGKEIA
jgi:hypothetical protein